MSPPFCTPSAQGLEDFWNRIVEIGSDLVLLAKEIGVVGLNDNIINFIIGLKRGNNVLTQAFIDKDFAIENGVCNCANYVHFLKVCVLALYMSSDVVINQICVVVLSTILKKIERDSKKGLENFKLEPKKLFNQMEKYALLS